ncbi:MAG: Holliday junction resolvase RuvX [Verrucomicrobiota bacterium]
MRCIGIDYGERRVGVSFGDEIGVATPLPALTQGTEEERIEALVAVANERGATDLVFGYPYNMNGSVGFKAKEVDAFIEKVRKRIDLPAHRIDERLTSHQVKQTIGRKRDDELRKSGKIDSASATLILQDFLDQNAQLPDYDPYGEEDADYDGPGGEG